MNLYERLRAHPARDLSRALGADWIGALKQSGMKLSLDDPQSSDLLASIIASIFGERVLDNQNLRRLFLSSLPSERVLELGAALLKTCPASVSDSLLALSNLKWSRTSPLAEVFLDELGFNSDYLPDDSIKLPARELVTPNIALHDLFDYQRELVSRISSEEFVKGDNFLVQLPTGSGKTRVMMEAIADYAVQHGKLPGGKGILWLAHSQELLEQALDTFKKVWAVRSNFDIFSLRLYGNFNPALSDVQDAIAFGSLQKLGRLASHHPAAITNLSSRLGLIIVDEAHKVAAPTYLRAVEMLGGSRDNILVGVTATPGRSSQEDSENRLLASIFSGNLITANLGEEPVRVLQEKGVLAKLDRILINSGLDIGPPSARQDETVEADFSSRDLKRVGNMPRRNELIINAISQEVSKGNSIIVFACSVDHARLLSAALAVRGIKSGYLDGKTPEMVRREVISGYRLGTIKALINYEILSTGFDAPITKAVMIARPTNSIILYSQMIGRGLRGPKVGGNEFCRLIEIVDQSASHGGLEDVYSYFQSYWL